MKTAGDSTFAEGGTEQLHRTLLQLLGAGGHTQGSGATGGFPQTRTALMATKAKMVPGAQGPAPLSHQGVPLPWQICLQR